MSSQTQIDAFFIQFPGYTEEERVRITEAWDWLSLISAGMTRPCGEPYTDHPLRVASILAGLKMDAETIISGLLHNALSIEGVTAGEAEKRFGAATAKIISGTSRLAGFRINNKTLQQAESVRKMLFAMTEDIRVILVKLADRLDRMRNLKMLPPEKQKSVAQETIDIWAPLANRLGISSIKAEMEDLSLKFSNPDVYEQIKHIVSLKKGERAAYLEKAQKEIYKAAEKEHISVTVSTRAKHFYSIYQKMRKRNKSADELYDLMALRILCDSPNECYTLIGLVHKLWKPLEGRFKDYIAMPKPNGYQSLHTTVMCDGVPLEIQIRTHEMHNVAEHGVASHWLYKKGMTRDTVSAEVLPLINRLKEIQYTGVNDEEFLNEIKEELLGDSIFVFTPKGDVIELPAGATAIDFAYYIHSAVGEKITGAKADGQIIPLASPLKNTQVIEILTSPQAHPTINQLQFVKTAKARSKIRGWLQMHDDSLIFDKNIVARRRAQAETQEQAETAKHVHGTGRNQQGPESAQAVSDTARQAGNAESAKTAQQPAHAAEPVKIRVGDSTNFLITIARCCSPVPGDRIVGYVSRGRGIIVHREDCRNVKRIPNIDSRLIDVAWEKSPAKNESRLFITAQINEDVFPLICSKVKAAKGFVLEGKLEETEAHTYEGTFAIRVQKKEDMKRLIKALRAEPLITKVTLLN